MMHAWNNNLARVLLILGTLVSLMHSENLYAVDWQNPCSEELKTFCDGVAEHQMCLIEHRDEIGGVCLERMLAYLERHPELDEKKNPEPQNFFSYDIYQQLPQPKPQQKIKPKVIEPNCDGINSLNSECYSRY